MKHSANYGNISLLSVLSKIYSGAQLVSGLRGKILFLNFGMSPSKCRRNTENILILWKIIDKFLRRRRSEVSW